MSHKFGKLFGFESKLDRRKKARDKVRPMVETLERRDLMSTVWMSNNWDLTLDQGTIGVLDSGDQVTNNNNATCGLATSGTITKTIGTDAYGTVTTGSVTGPIPSATNSGSTITKAFADRVNGDTINVFQGSYGDSINISKKVTFNGAQFGVDARGRVGGTYTPSTASETVWSPTANQGGASIFISTTDVTLNGFSFVEESGAGQGSTQFLGTTTTSDDRLSILNNFLASNTGTQSMIVFGRSSQDCVMDRNEFYHRNSTVGSIQIFGNQNASGLHFTNNNVLRPAAFQYGQTGVSFADTAPGGNFGISTSGTTILVKGNLFDGWGTGLNISSTFGSAATANAGEISENTFSNNLFGLVGSPQNANVKRNTFSNNAVGFQMSNNGRTQAAAAPRSSTISENVFSGNTREDIDFIANTATQAGFLGTNVITGNSFADSHGVSYDGTELLNLSANWWGTNTLAGIKSHFNSEIQSINININNTSGNYTLTFGTETTANIAFNASASTVQTELENLTAFAPGDITVVKPIIGGSLPAGSTQPYYLIFETTGAYGRSNVAQITLNNVSLNGTVPVPGTSFQGTTTTNNDFTPWLDVSTDTSGTAGFQGSYALLNVDDDSPQSTLFGPAGRVQEGNDLASSGGTVKVWGGTYAESPTISKTVKTQTTLVNITGTVTTTSTGTLAPGFSPGLFSIGPAGVDITVGTYACELQAPGTTAGTDYDQLAITGTVTLGGTLAVTSSFSPAGATTYKIIDNDTSGDAVVGTFATLPQGATLTATGGDVYTISYIGGDGNDVVLTAAAGATPPTVSSITVNDGNVQRSMVSGITVVFDQAVTLDASAITLALHPGVSINGGGGTTVGTLPTVNYSSGDGGITWVVTWSGAGVGNAPAASIADGVYDMTVDKTKVHVGATFMTTNGALLFHRLFGDGNTGADNVGGTFSVNNADFLQFKATFGKSFGDAGYNAAYDINGYGTGAGTVNNTDNLAFKLRFGTSYSY